MISALNYVNPYDENEIFVPIFEHAVPNVKPWYLISTKGRVYSLHSKRLLKPTVSFDGYKVCTLRTFEEKGVTVYIHRIEMLSFKYEEGCEELDVDHVDCDKSNNTITNLEWLTTAENTRRAAINNLMLSGEDAPWTKVTDNQVHEICRLYISNVGITEISKILNCCLNSVYRVVHGINRTNISCMYDIESRYRGYLSEEQIHYICKTFSEYKGLRYIDIKRILENRLNLKITNQIDTIMRCLYRHDIYCFYEISSLYEY